VLLSVGLDPTFQPTLKGAPSYNALQRGLPQGAKAGGIVPSQVLKYEEVHWLACAARYAWCSSLAYAALRARAGERHPDGPYTIVQ